MTTNDQPSQALGTTWALGFLVLLVSIPSALYFGTMHGLKSLERSCFTSTQGQALKQGSDGDGKQKEPFGLRKPGYGRTPY